MTNSELFWCVEEITRQIYFLDNKIFWWNKGKAKARGTATTVENTDIRP